MASAFELNYTKKHGVCESTLLLATMSGGHFYNMVSDENIDNGSVAVLDIVQYQEGDTFKTVKPKIKDKIVLINTPEKIYEDFSKQCQEECYFFNAAGELMRAYEVYDTDRFSLSREAFKDEPTVEPEKGKYVVVDPSGYKLDVVETNPNETTVTNGFVGYIYGLNANGSYKVFVIRNREVEA